MATRRRSEQRGTIILVQVSASGHVTSHLVPAVLPSTATQMQLLHLYKLASSFNRDVQ